MPHLPLIYLKLYAYSRRIPYTKPQPASDTKLVKNVLKCRTPSGCRSRPAFPRLLSAFDKRSRRILSAKFRGVRYQSVSTCYVA
jgi:hypothetical protein